MCHIYNSHFSYSNQSSRPQAQQQFWLSAPIGQIKNAAMMKVRERRFINVAYHRNKANKHFIPSSRYCFQF